MVFLALRGNIIADDGGIELRRRPSSSSVNSDIASAQVTAIAKKMFWYPISYVIIVLPISIARLISLRGNMNAVPEWVWLLGITCLFLSGGRSSPPAFPPGLTRCRLRQCYHIHGDKEGALTHPLVAVIVLPWSCLPAAIATRRNALLKVLGLRRASGDAEL